MDFMEKIRKESEFTTNNILNITQPPEFILKILIIQARDNLKNAIEHYYILKTSGVNPTISHAKARAINLFLEVREPLREYLVKEKIDPDKFEEELLLTKDFNIVYKVRNQLDKFLYDKRLIRFDNIVDAKLYDVEDSNNRAGYK
jgi:hypothetical protein